MSTNFLPPLHPRQCAAFESPATEVLFGGGIGCGKGYLLRYAAIRWAMENPGLQVYFFRRTIPELIINHLEGPGSFPEMLAPLSADWGVRIKKSKIEFSNGSTIHLAACPTQKACAEFEGHEFHALLIDMVNHFSGPMYRALRSRVRMPRHQEAPKFPRILCSATPGGPGHKFVKQYWVDNGPGVVFTDPTDAPPLSRAFYPALMEDNPSLSFEAGENYIGSLRALCDPKLIRSLLDGDWTIEPTPYAN